MADFAPFDLARVLQTAETIKGMRRKEEDDSLQRAYMRSRDTRENAQEQRAAAQFDQQQAQYAAEVLHRAMSQVEQSQDPIAASHIVLQDPEIGALFQKVGVNPAALSAKLQQTQDPEAVRAGAAQMRQRFQPFIAPKSGDLQLETITGPDGQPMLVPRQMAVGQKPYSNQPSSYEEFIRAQKDPAFAQFLRERRGQGLSVTLPDGTTISDGGNQPFALPKPTQNKLGDDYTSSIAGMQRLQTMVAAFDPRFLTYGGKAKGFWSSIKAKTPEVFGQLPPDEQQYLSRYTNWQSDTLDNLNRYIKDITGAAMSEAEATRIQASVPSPDDDPVSFKSKLDTTMKRLSLVAARAAYLLSNPAQSVGDISLDRMQAIITDRANALYAGYLQQGMNEQQARQQALQEARSQYGLSNAGPN